MSLPTLTHVCPDCASGLLYDDWTHVLDDEEHASISASVELLGHAAYNGTAPDRPAWSGYCRCPVCGHDFIGPGSLFYTERAA
jgi:uncharacterized protein (DUF983 family)